MLSILMSEEIVNPKRSYDEDKRICLLQKNIAVLLAPLIICLLHRPGWLQTLTLFNLK